MTSCNPLPEPFLSAPSCDFDGDGKSDILWRNSSTGEHYIYLMDGLTVKLSSGFIPTVPLDWLPMLNRPPLVTLTAPANNSSATAGTQVSLSAEAIPGNAGRSISQIEFFVSGNGSAAISAGIATSRERGRGRIEFPGALKTRPRQISQSGGVT